MPEAPATGTARAWAEAAAGSLAYWQADHATARQHYERQVELATAAGDEAAVADAWFNLSHVLFLQDEPGPMQREFQQRVVARYRDLGDEWGMARAEWAFAVIAMSKGEVDEASARLESDRERFERLDDRQYLAMTNGSLAWVAFVNGDVPGAIRSSVASLTEAHAMRDLGTTTISLHVGVLIAAMLGRAEDAARLWGAFHSLCERYGVRPPASLERFIGDMDPVGVARAALAPEDFDAAVEEGRHLTLDDAVALIVELGDMADQASPPPRD
jgi:hypothetical protein